MKKLSFLHKKYLTLDTIHSFTYFVFTLMIETSLCVEIREQESYYYTILITTDDPSLLRIYKTMVAIFFILIIT